MPLTKNKSCLYYIIPALVFLLLSGFFLLTFSRLDIHLFINKHHTAWADVLFKNITHLGDGLIFILAIPFAFFKSLRAFFTIGFTGLIVGITTGILKNFVFGGYPRPSKFYENIDLYYVPGVELHSINSFPSGHTMAAFAFYFSVCYVIQKKWAAVGLILLATFVGYSRMYLSQHFLVDVLAGGILGLIAGMLAVKLADNWKWNKLDKTILQLIK